MNEYTLKKSLKVLRSALNSLRGRTPSYEFPLNRAAASDIRTGYLSGKPVRRLVVTLRAPGCEWVTQGGGCVMCGHYAGTSRGHLPSTAETVTQFQSEISHYDLENIEVLSIYNSGSVLNPAELNFEALRRIFFLIREMPAVKKVVIESRAEYVNREKIVELKDILGQERILSIAMGLETSDDLIRELCINKNCTLEKFKKAISSLKGTAETQIYILFGIPFLTEREIIEDAIHSLRCAVSLGADEIHIEPATLQKHTLTCELARAGLYRLPSLYSLFEVLKAVVPDILPYVSPFMHMPLPLEIPAGCSLCTEKLIHSLLKKYNIYRSRTSLEYLPCPCLKEWRKRLEITDSRPLERRVEDALTKLTRVSNDTSILHNHLNYKTIQTH